MIIAVLVACWTWQAPRPHGPGPGERAALAGLAGIRTVSRIDFGEAANRLTAAYTFPDRARWHFESYGARVRSEHQYFYRLGETVQAFDGRPSRELPAVERDALVRQMELRRAAFLWPDGFAWEAGADEVRTAPIYLDSCCREGRVGSLRAALVGGRPGRIELRDLQGTLLEALEILSWQEHAGRLWPRTLAMSGSQGSFTETVESIEAQVHLLEVSFVPPDRRELPRAEGPGPAVLARDVVAMTYAAHALPAGTSWEAAQRIADERREAARGELSRSGLQVDPVPTFELAPDGQPRAVLLRLAAPCTPPPEGYVTRPERPGLFLLLGSPSELSAPLLERLLDMVPEGARPDGPYVRIHERKEVPVEVVLPLVEG